MPTYSTRLPTFSAVRFHTVTVWPIFSKLETMPLPIRPSPRNPILRGRQTLTKKRDYVTENNGCEPPVVLEVMKSKPWSIIGKKKKKNHTTQAEQQDF